MELATGYKYKDDNNNITEYGFGVCDEGMKKIFDIIYPIGSIYTTSSFNSPPSIGKWELINKEIVNDDITINYWKRNN